MAAGTLSTHELRSYPMKFVSTRWARSASVTFAALAAAACNSGDAVSPAGTPAATPSAVAAFQIGVEFSSADAAVGQNVEIGVGLDGSLPSDLGAIGGTLRFDASKLEYLGLEADQNAFVVANAGATGLRFSSVRVPQLDRSAATFVFRVTAPGYTSGLRIDLAEAVQSGSDVVFTAAPTFGARRSSDVTVSAAIAPQTTEEWTALASQKGFRSSAETSLGGSTLGVAGAANIYGDVNNSGSVTSGDLGQIGNASVGNIIVLDTLVARDVALGGNLRPLNSADGITVGFGDLCPLGVTCTAAAPFSTVNAGAITAADFLAVANFLVGNTGNASAGVGVAIPKTATTGTRVTIAGTLDAARCTATPADCNWTRGNVYELQGIVNVDNGGVLNIQSGVRVEGLTGAASGSPLFVGRRGQIFAIGERTAPIVFTCTATTKSKGCWGGLAILGSAPVNEQGAGTPISDATRNPGGAGNSRTLEGAPTDFFFGGANADDNSGTLRFVRIEYAGNILGANNELNGLTLGGVGRGTTIEYVQVHGGLDDGYELFGGTVNARYLVLTGNSDDAYDWSFGWQGSAQFVIIQQDSLDSEKAFEGDNTETGATFGNTPRTNGPLYNFTAFGTLYPASISGNTGNNVNDAVHIRRGNGSTVSNAIIVGFPFILDLDDAATCNNSAADPAIRNSFVGGFGAAGNPDGSDPTCATGSTEQLVLENAVNANTIGSADPTIAALVLRRGFDVLAPDFRPREGAALPTPVAIPAGNTFLVTTTYVGAVEPETANTRNNLPWYAGWTRGFATTTAP